MKVHTTTDVPPATSTQANAAAQAYSVSFQFEPPVGPPSYDGSGIKVWYQTVDFPGDTRFLAAYREGMASAAELVKTLGGNPENVRFEWPVLVCCWAAWHARHLAGDFVECGTNTGVLSLAVCNYIDFNSLDKSFYLFDTYSGIPAEQISASERSQGREALSRAVYSECYEATKARFARYPRAHLVRGKVPGTLETVQIDRVCYLSIDMNCVFPEIAAIEYFWPKPNKHQMLCLM